MCVYECMIYMYEYEHILQMNNAIYKIPYLLIT